jgi:hypothetical protein
MKSMKPQPAEARCPRCGSRQPAVTPMPDQPGWMTCSRHCGFEGRGIAQRTDTGTRTLPLTQKPFSGTMIVIGESIACSGNSKACFIERGRPG